MPSVQWYREGALIPHSRDFEVSTGIRITHNTILECTCKATCCMYEHTQATFIRSTLSHMHSVCVLFSWCSYCIYIIYWKNSSREITNFVRLQKVIKKGIIKMVIAKISNLQSLKVFRDNSCQIVIKYVKHFENPLMSNAPKCIAMFSSLSVCRFQLFTTAFLCVTIILRIPESRKREKEKERSNIFFFYFISSSFFYPFLCMMYFELSLC